MKNIKILLATLFIISSINSVQAQVGIGTTAPNGALDITSTNEGLLIPRVALVNTTTVTVLTGTASELVYNTATSGDVTPGFYYLSTATGPWIRLATGGSGWQITGNTDIVNNVNFMGTGAGNNVDVAFRRNNVAAGKISATSTSFGVGALTAGATSNSIAFGNNALVLNTGANNVAVGTAALTTNVTGIQNTGIGNSALTLNTGSANSALGFEALRSNSIGNNNTGIGFEALRSNTTASNNTGIGFQALRSNSTGTSNTAVGFQAGENTTSSSNTSLGFQAHQMNTTGNQNVAIGERSLGRNSGSQNTIIGFEAMFGTTSSSNNSTAVGYHALFSNSGASNTAVGWNASQGGTTAINNTAMGAGSLNNNTTGSRNTAVGRDAGFAATSSDGTFIGFNAGAYSTGTQNTAVGANALDENAATARNVAIGYNALTSTTASNNTAVGHSALQTVGAGSGNVALGYQAGFAETGSNKLYISNSNTSPTTSLIYGEFAPTRILRTNSTFQIGDPTTTGYQFPVARGADTQLLQTNAAGVLSWVNPSVLAVTEIDPQVSSVTNNAIPKWNGTTLLDGIITDNGTSVTIAGNTTTTTLQMTNGATANYILQSDAAGNGTWVQNPLNTLSLVRVNLGGSNQVLTAPAPLGTWEKINFSTEVFDTSAEFAGGTFTATKAGFYQINAGFHTNDQTNLQQYAIGVFVNGVLYQETSGNHTNLGEVSRNINCIVNLAIGNTVEIFVKNFISGVEINGFIGKTFFEIQQIR
ncbi:hypothetical protein M0M57_10580 [Flavobacterium azooxidireducens]|uniref:C1q domain-containing protein n=1 Tax=Flavobacterium azooxidireducens TaxID=1871076 RepID=A0ABY4KF00_9FLAO|nr:hypothetical protein [Flavobacterium azooxidireducens]UPQ78067.1 hypothetical protein M0M57_10580 [Flavobacterium azooxidireducens]